MICHFSVLFKGDTMKLHRDFEIDVPKLSDYAIELIKKKAKSMVAGLKKEYEDESGEKKDIGFYEVYVVLDGKETVLFRYSSQSF